MKKLSLLLALLMTLMSLTAFAAPARDLTDLALENEELIAQVQPLVDAVAAVAFTHNLLSLEQNAAPDAVLSEGLLYQAFYDHVLVASANEMQIRLSMEEAGKALDSLFFAENLPGILGESLPSLVINGDVVSLDISPVSDFIGAHIYDISPDEEELSVKADVYRLSGFKGPAIEAPEDSLTWLGAISLSLKPEADSAVGFSLAGFTVLEHYQPTSLLQFTQKDRFELQYPDLFVNPVEDSGSFISLLTGDGQASLKVSEVPGSLEELLSAWQNEQGEVKVENERAIFTAPGLVRLAYADPQDGQDVCLVLEMSYPTERELEFTLYKTFLDNSFVVYSHSMG